MDIVEAKQVLDSYIGQKKNELVAFEIIKDLFDNGYQSDQHRIDTEIANGISSAVENAEAPLREQIASLLEEKAILRDRVDALTSPDATVDTPEP